MKHSFVSFAVAAVSSLLFACSDSGKTGDGTSGQQPSGSSGSSGQQPSGSSGRTPASSSTSSSQTCQSSSLNGRCTAGPKKGATCCYAPDNASDPPCAASSECENVCRYCQ